MTINHNAVNGHIMQGASALPRGRRSAFTLIELLVVVAVLVILATIALPNFLEAQTRSKVSRAKSDMRIIAVALETYHVDSQRYPPSTLVPRFARLLPLTTPIMYLANVPLDVFVSERANDAPWPFRRMGNFSYGAMPIDQESRWALASDGPDRIEQSMPIEFYPGYSTAIWENPASGFQFIRYDPTNGTTSPGDIWRVSDANLQ